MKQDEFVIKTYGKSELAMLYFPDNTPETAMKKLRSWLRINPRLSLLISSKTRFFTPKQVRMIVDEVGEPFDT